jgi:hypothetical protein
MNRDAHSVRRKVNQAWDVVRQAIQIMYRPSQVRPGQADDVFKLDPSTSDNEVKFNVGPIAFNLPEKANHRDLNLFIVLSGWLSFEGPHFKDDILHTKSYGTEVGYFRSKRGDVDHIYGAHYDLDENKAGHPVFHAQMSPQLGLLDFVNGLFHKQFANPSDRVTPILHTVRTPTAQMDVFSVVAQLCADHLFDGSPSAIEAFANLRNATRFFLGAAYRMKYLNSGTAINCYRSSHWYPV